MFNFSDLAKEKIRLMLKDKDPKEWGVRLRYDGGAQVDITPSALKDMKPEDTVLIFKKKKLFIEVEDFKAILPKAAEFQLEGASVDYVDGGILRGVFEVSRPQEEAKVSGLDLSNPQVKKIYELLKNEINPAIAMHGGYAELLDVKNNTVYLRLGGGCHGCGMADVTLRQGIEIRIKEEVPEIEAVIDQTNHAGGTNPYYQSNQF